MKRWHRNVITMLPILAVPVAYWLIHPNQQIMLAGTVVAIAFSAALGMLLNRRQP